MKIRIENERLACSLDYKTPIQYKTELGFLKFFLNIYFFINVTKVVVTSTIYFFSIQQLQI